MYRAIPVVSPIVDMKMKERGYKLHSEVLSNMKPRIDVSTPPEVPRLIVYHKRLVKERKWQLQMENENIRLIKEVESRRNMIRKAITPPTKSRPMTDWVKELSIMNQNAVNNQLPPISGVSTQRRPASRTSIKQKKVMHDDGMIVLDVVQEQKRASSNTSSRTKPQTVLKREESDASIESTEAMESLKTKTNNVLDLSAYMEKVVDEIENDFEDTKNEKEVSEEDQVKDTKNEQEVSEEEQVKETKNEREVSEEEQVKETKNEQVDERSDLLGNDTRNNHSDTSDKTDIEPDFSGDQNTTMANDLQQQIQETKGQNDATNTEDMLEQSTIIASEGKTNYNGDQTENQRNLEDQKEVKVSEEEVPTTTNQDHLVGLSQVEGSQNTEKTQSDTNAENDFDFYEDEFSNEQNTMTSKQTDLSVNPMNSDIVGEATKPVISDTEDLKQEEPNTNTMVSSQSQQDVEEIHKGETETDQTEQYQSPSQVSNSDNEEKQDFFTETTNSVEVSETTPASDETEQDHNLPQPAYDQIIDPKSASDDKAEHEENVNEEKNDTQYPISNENEKQESDDRISSYTIENPNPSQTDIQQNEQVPTIQTIAAPITEDLNDESTDMKQNIEQSETPISNEEDIAQQDANTKKEDTANPANDGRLTGMLKDAAGAFEDTDDPFGDDNFGNYETEETNQKPKDPVIEQNETSILNSAFGDIIKGLRL